MPDPPSQPLLPPFSPAPPIVDPHLPVRPRPAPASATTAVPALRRLGRVRHGSPRPRRARPRPRAAASCPAASPSSPCHGLLLTGPRHRPSPHPPRLLLADDASSSSSPKAQPSLAAPCSPTPARTPVLLLLPVPSRRCSPAPPHYPLAAGSHRTARRARRRFPHSPPSLHGLAPLLPLRRSRCLLLLRPASLAVAGLASAQSG
nr:vegetative cell wall protein gp1-like [Aegilops tauschii subsp. strangulata]